MHVLEGLGCRLSFEAFYLETQSDTRQLEAQLTNGVAFKKMCYVIRRREELSKNFSNRGKEVN